MTARNASSIVDFFSGAAQVLVSAEAQGRYEHWDDAISAPSVKPSPPKTQAEATPQFLLRGPFKDDPDLHGVAFYVGIGFIEIRMLSDTQCTYETSTIDGSGVDERLAFLMAARELFFHDVNFKPGVSA